MGLRHSPSIVRDGLVSHLDAANKKSYPGSGITWTDLSNSGNNGTLTNGPAFSATNAGSVVFDGTNDFVIINHSNSLTSTTALTINCWVKASAFSNSYSSIIGKGTSDSNEEYCLLIHNNFLYFDVGGVSGPYTQPSYAFSLNTWYNICCIHSRSTSSSMSIYVNSIAIANSVVNPSSSPNNNTAPVSIGSRFHNTVFAPFTGSIASASLYNRSLSLNEIKQNFNALRGRFGI